MFAKTKKYSVKNRSASRIFYDLPDFEKGVTRTFMPGEVKPITGEELLALTYRDGGQNLINEFLLIEDADAKAEVVTNDEPEYDLDEAGVYKLLVEGTCDQLYDCLNFGPEGVKDLVKQLAIEMPLNDLNKCEVIHELLGYDVASIVKINKEIAAEEAVDNKTVAPTKTRKSKTAEVETVPAKKTRKVAQADYSKE